MNWFLLFLGGVGFWCGFFFCVCCFFLLVCFFEIVSKVLVYFCNAPLTIVMQSHSSLI